MSSSAFAANLPPLTSSSSTKCTWPSRPVYDAQGNWIGCRVVDPITGEVSLKGGDAAGSGIHGIPDLFLFNTKAGTWDYYQQTSATSTLEIWEPAVTDLAAGLATGVVTAVALSDIDEDGDTDLLLGDPKASDSVSYGGGVAVFFSPVPNADATLTGDDYDVFVVGKTKSQKLGTKVEAYSKNKAIVYDGAGTAKYAMGPFTAETAPEYFGDSGTTAIKPETLKLGL